MKPLFSLFYTFKATLFVSATLCFYQLSFNYCILYFQLLYFLFLQDCFVELIREEKKQQVDFWYLWSFYY